MEEEIYEYNGKQYTYAQLQGKYGERVDDAISKFGFKKIEAQTTQQQDVYVYNDKEYTYKDLQEKYGERTNDAIKKFGFVKKKEASSQGTPTTFTPTGGTTPQQQPPSQQGTQPPVSFDPTSINIYGDTPEGRAKAETEKRKAQAEEEYNLEQGFADVTSDIIKVENLINELDQAQQLKQQTESIVEFGTVGFKQGVGVEQMPPKETTITLSNGITVSIPTDLTREQAREQAVKQAAPTLNKKVRELVGVDIIDEQTGEVNAPVAQYVTSVGSKELEKQFEFQQNKIEQIVRENNRFQSAFKSGVLNIAGGLTGIVDPKGAQLILENAQTYKTSAAIDAGLTEQDIENGIVGNLTEGNFKAGLTNLYLEAFSQTPQLAFMYMTGGTAGIGILGASAGGAEYARLYDRVDISNGEKMLRASLIGITEALTERLGSGDINIALRVLGQKEIKNIGIDVLKNIKSPFSKQFLEEGGEELIAGFTEQLINKIADGEDFDVNSLIDQALIGGVSVTPTTALAYTVSKGQYAIASKQNQLLYSQGKEEISSINEALNTQGISQEEKDVLTKRKERIQSELLEKSIEDLVFYNQFSEEDLNRVYDINEELTNISAKKETALTDVAKTEYDEQIKTLAQEKQAIEEKYTNQQVTNQQVTPEVVTEQQVEQQLTPEELEAKKDDIQKRRQEELNQYDQEGLKETYTVGSEQTVEEYINAKYDAELSALEQQATPTQQTQQGETQRTTAVATEVAQPTQENKKASDLLDNFEKGTDVSLDEFDEAGDVEDGVIKSIFEQFKKAFKNIRIVGKRPTEGAAFYDTNEKRIEVNKNSTHWKQVDSKSLIGALVHEFVHESIDKSENKDRIESDLQRIKDDLISNPPKVENESDKKLLGYITAKNNSPQEVLTYMASNPELRKYLSKHTDKLNEISQELFGVDVMQQEKQVKDEKDGQRPKAGNRIFNKPLEAVKGIADKYYQRVFGKKRPAFNGVTGIDKELAKRISDAYDAMKNDPNDPEVRAAYEALAKETMEQYKAFAEAGYTIEINNEEPYNNAQEMIDDLRENKRMKIFSTESGFGGTPITEQQRRENPLLRDSGVKDVNGNTLLVNDIFRAIHDFYGHAELGNGFGAIGEENAWNVHARMFSPLARRAMTTETRGQNSWVNFSGVNEEAFKLRDKARQLRREGKEEEAQAVVAQVYEIMSFAEQKVGLLPVEFSEPTETKQDDTQAKQQVPSGKQEGKATEQAKPKQEPSGKKAEAGGDVQAPTEERVELRGEPTRRAQRLQEIAEIAFRAIKRMYPNLKINIYSSTEEFVRGTNDKRRGVRGTFDGNTGTISINADIALDTTIAHEVFHAVLFQALGGLKNKNIERVVMLSSEQIVRVLLRTLDKNSSQYKEIVRLKKVIDEAVQGGAYSRKDAAEEVITNTIEFLQKNFESLKPKAIQVIKEALNRIAKALRLPPLFEQAAKDREVLDFLNSYVQNVTVGGDLTAVGEAIGKYSESELAQLNEIFTPSSSINGAVNVKDSRGAYVDGLDTTPPKVTSERMVYPEGSTVQQVLDRCGGAIMFVNSDGTKVGSVVVNGRKLNIQGGIDYTFIEENIKNKIGFSASDIGKVSKLDKVAQELIAERDAKTPQHKGKPVAVFVVSQNASAVLGEWYSSEYIMEGIDAALSKKKYRGGLRAAKSDFVQAILSVKLGKSEDGKSDLAAREKLIGMIRDGKFDTHGGRLEIAERLSSSEFSFAFRKNLNESILASNARTANSGKNIAIKKALVDVGHFIEDVYNKFIDERLLSLINKQKSPKDKDSATGGITFSGFMYDPYSSLESKRRNATNGINHKQFNFGFTSTETFLLDRAMYVNRWQPNMGFPTSAGIDAYNRANNAQITKQSPITDKNKVSKWLNENNLSSLVVSPYTSISMSMYTAINASEEVSVSGKSSIILPENSSNFASMTEDEDGNFVFFHVGDRGYKEIRPASGATRFTSRQEAAAIGKVGGVAMYYTSLADNEMTARETRYAVSLPKESVYDADADPNGYYERGKELHEIEHKGMGYDGNTQVAYITKLAINDGYKMVVARWKNSSRAQTTLSLQPTDEMHLSLNTITKDFDRTYTSNKGKYTIVDKESRQSALAPVYTKIDREVVKNDFRHPLAQLAKMSFYTLGDKYAPFKTQEQITEAVMSSDIPKQYKDEYMEALERPLEVGKSVPIKSSINIAPNGKVSNLNDELYKTVRTKEFKEWFGDWENDKENASKVLDKNGEPLVVFHGGRKFDTFKRGEKDGDIGIYFTDNYYFAQNQFALEVELFERDKRGDYTDEFVEKLESDEIEISDLKYSTVHSVFLNIRNPIQRESLNANLIPKLYNKENDGVIVESTGDFGYWGGQFVVFNPNQIKTADGTNKKFDSTNDNIKSSLNFDSQTSTKNVMPEVRRLKKLPMGKEDGSTINLDGTKYDGGGLVVPVISYNTTQKDLSVKDFIDFIVENISKISNSDVFKLGFYKFEDSEQISIDLNIVVPRKHRAVAIEFGRQAGQKKLFDLDTYKYVETGADELNPASFTDEQFARIGEALSKGELPKVGLKSSVNTQMSQDDMELDDHIRATPRTKKTTLQRVREFLTEDKSRVLGFATKKIVAALNAKEQIESNMAQTNITSLENAMRVKKLKNAAISAVARANGISKNNARVIVEKLMNNVLSPLDNKTTSVDAIAELSAISKKLAVATLGLRTHIDTMTDLLMKSPAFKNVDAATRKRVLENIGNYLHREYLFFLDKSYEPSDTLRRRAIQLYAAENNVSMKKAIEYVEDLIGQWKKVRNPIVSVNNKMTTASLKTKSDAMKKRARKPVDADLWKEAGIFAQKKYKGVKNSDELEYLERVEYYEMNGGTFQELPDYLRDLLGEIKEPTARYINTMMAMGDIYYKANAMKQLVEDYGDGKWIRKDKPHMSDIENFQQINDKYSPLNGMWVHRKIIEEFNVKPLYKTDSILLNTYYWIQQLLRKTKILPNPATWLKNITGGYFSQFANGDWMLTRDPSSIASSMWGRFMMMTKNERNDFVKRIWDDAAKAGVLATGIDLRTLAYIDDMYRSIETGDELLFNRSLNTLAKMAKQAPKQVNEGLGKRYAQIDDYTKAIAVMLQKEVVSVMMFDKEYSSLTDSQKLEVLRETGSRVKRGYPTFSRLPSFFGGIARLPFGDFLSFSFESSRAFAGSNLIGFEDAAAAATGKRNGKTLSATQRSEYAKSAARRMFASSTLIAITTMIKLGMMGRDDDDDDTDEKKALKESVFTSAPDWASGRALVLKDIKPDGTVSFYDYSGQDPYAETISMLSGDYKSLENLMNGSMMWRLIVESSTGEDQVGRRIYTKDEGAASKTKKIAKHFGKAFIPPIVSSVVWGKKTMQSAEPDWGDANSKGMISAVGDYAALTAGRATIRDYQYNVYKQATYLAYKINSDDFVPNLEQSKTVEEIDIRINNLINLRDYVRVAILHANAYPTNELSASYIDKLNQVLNDSRRFTDFERAILFSTDEELPELVKAIQEDKMKYTEFKEQMREMKRGR